MGASGVLAFAAAGEMALMRFALVLLLCATVFAEHEHKDFAELGAEALTPGHDLGADALLDIGAKVGAAVQDSAKAKVMDYDHALKKKDHAQLEYATFRSATGGTLQYDKAAHYVRHMGDSAEVTTASSEADKRDIVWKIRSPLCVPGSGSCLKNLKGNPKCMSFESANWKGYYLRHKGTRMHLEKPRGNTLPLAKADAALAVFRACDLALVPQISFGTLAKCHLLHLVIQAFAMPVAHFTLRGTRAFSIACFAFPGSHAFTLGLAQLIHTAFAVLAAHLLAKSLGASLCTILAHTAELAPARSFLLLLVKQARASARTAHLAPIQKARALHHALGPSTTACTGALLRLHWTLACTEKFRVLLVEGGIFAKGIKAGATTAPLVGVVADVQVISIVAHEKLGLAQRLE